MADADSGGPQLQEISDFIKQRDKILAALIKQLFLNRFDIDTNDAGQ